MGWTRVESAVSRNKYLYLPINDMRDIITDIILLSSSYIAQSRWKQGKCYGGKIWLLPSSLPLAVLLLGMCLPSLGTLRGRLATPPPEAFAGWESISHDALCHCPGVPPWLNSDFGILLPAHSHFYNSSLQDWYSLPRTKIRIWQSLCKSLKNPVFSPWEWRKAAFPSFPYGEVGFVRQVWPVEGGQSDMGFLQP